ncbi:MAG TPA: flagellar motor switch protein FliM [Firmicutes bacterium]|nr:flagellar motor switch protein FliM [Bacillota bacterium]HBT15522.1 flagellar motor switch protein FliM [Bacillota bacterium]
MAEILTQNEIDSLLQALSTGAIDAESVKTEEKTRRVRPYDFRRPSKFAKEQIRTLVMIHENFSRLLTSSLSAYLRTMVQSEVASVDQLTYEEFTKSLQNPTVINIMGLKPLDGSIVLEFAPNLAFAFIDRLLGGQGAYDGLIRELTEIEQMVTKRVVMRIANSVKEAWNNVMSIDPEYQGMETNPLFTQVIPPTEMVILVTLDLKVAEISGLMNLCYPYILLEPVLNRLSSQFWFASSKKNFSPEDINTLTTRLKEATIPIDVELGKTIISVRDMLNLTVGDVIKVEQSVKNPLVVKVGKEEKYYGFPGLSNNKLAIQLYGTKIKGGEKDVK